MRTFGGTFAGRLDVDSRQPTPQLRLNGRLDGLDVVELLKASGSPGGVTGKLGGSVALTGRGSEAQTLIQTSRGSISAAVTDGSLPNLDDGEDDRAGIREAVRGAAGGIRIRLPAPRRRLLAGRWCPPTSSSLMMASRDFDMSGTGSLRIISGAAQARARRDPRDELTAQAGTDLRRYAQQDGRVVVPVAISGTLQQPTVTPDLAAATRRALGNELKRRATSFLEGLFKKK